MLSSFSSSHVPTHTHTGRAREGEGRRWTEGEGGKEGCVWGGGWRGEIECARVREGEGEGERERRGRRGARARTQPLSHTDTNSHAVGVLKRFGKLLSC